MQEIMFKMLLFLSVNCGNIDGIHSDHDPCNFNYDQKKLKLMPAIKFMPKEDIKKEMYSGELKHIPLSQQIDYSGAYIGGKNKILLPLNWDKNSSSDLSILFHELYHHMQFENNGKPSCVTDHETPAYKATLFYSKKVHNKPELLHDEGIEKLFMHNKKGCNPKYKWYEGDYMDGKYHGKGKFTYLDGATYLGEWKNGRKHGQGTFSFPYGDKYVGEYKNGKMEGQGTYFWKNGDKYVGNQKDEKKHGPGTFTWANGNKREGEWKDGKPVGHSILTWANGNKYEGRWKNEKMHGKGTFTFSNGHKYVGEYKDGKENGFGSFTWANGDIYFGEYKNGKMEGQGTFTFSNGQKYVGQWKVGRMDGEGTLTQVNGIKLSGNWKKDRPWNINVYEGRGQIIGKFVSGVEQ